MKESACACACVRKLAGGDATSSDERCVCSARRRSRLHCDADAIEIALTHCHRVGGAGVEANAIAHQLEILAVLTDLARNASTGIAKPALVAVKERLA